MLPQTTVDHYQAFGAGDDHDIASGSGDQPQVVSQPRCRERGVTWLSSCGRGERPGGCAAQEDLEKVAPAGRGKHEQSLALNRTGFQTALSQGSGIRDQGSGIRDQGSGIRDQEQTCRVPNPESRIPNPESRACANRPWRTCVTTRRGGGNTLEV